VGDNKVHPLRSLKKIAVTNAPAYFVQVPVMKEKGFMAQTFG
jgi:hypothetical protein